MTSKADFTDEEWTCLKRAPFVAGMAISLADPGGPIEALKETSATLGLVRVSEGHLGRVTPDHPVARQGRLHGRREL